MPIRCCMEGQEGTELGVVPVVVPIECCLEGLGVTEVERHWCGARYGAHWVLLGGVEGDRAG